MRQRLLYGRKGIVGYCVFARLCALLLLPPCLLGLFWVFFKGKSLGLQLSYCVNLGLDVGEICGRGMEYRKGCLDNVLIEGWAYLCCVCGGGWGHQPAQSCEQLFSKVVLVCEYLGECHMYNDKDIGRKTWLNCCGTDNVWSFVLHFFICHV